MLSSFELRARTNKFLEEQKARDEAERRRKEKEQLLEQRRKQREAEREEQERQRKLAELAAQEQALRQKEEDTEWNRGVYLAATLQPVEADDAATAAKGIRRSKDKVVLPASMSNELMNQDAAKNGTIFFELTSRVTGHTTHVAALEFTAPEGVIMLPWKVRESLFGNGGYIRGLVDLKYKRLEKGSFVCFQPLCRGFHEHVGEDVKHVLETSLSQYSALTVGDTMEIQHEGQQYALRVTDLKPHSAVSIIDTDIEAEVIASVETEKLIEEWEQEQRRNEERIATARAKLEAERAAAIAAREAQDKMQQEALEAQQRALEEQARQREEARARKLAALPPEPGPGNASGQDPSQPAIINCAFRLPNGSRLTRRFFSTSPILDLFAFIDAQEVEGCADYHLVTQFPRRTIARPMAVDDQPSETGSASQASQQDTLQSLGLGQGGQELFLLDPLGME